MAISLISQPTSEPLSSSDSTLRQQLQLEPDETEQDALVDALCAAARARVETYTRRRLLSQTVRVTRDHFGAGFDGPVLLPVGPVQAVEQVQFQDGSGTWRTVSPDDYDLQRSRSPHRLRPAYGRSWPVPRVHTDVVRIDLRVGYGDTVSDVPADILQAMRLLVAHLYFNREAASAAGTEEIPLGFRDMLSPHRIWL